MHNDTNKGLTVIDGGKGRGKKSGNKASPSGLTEKQERFSQLLAEGMTNSEAYRAAYDTSTMAMHTVHNEAAKLAKHQGVATRVNAILEEKRKRNSMLSEKQSDRVWRNVWRLAEGENVPPSVQQAALALAAKMAGMLTEQVKIENINADSKSIESELLERLQRLTA
jgi:hypothetical protein